MRRILFGALRISCAALFCVATASSWGADSAEVGVPQLRGKIVDETGAPVTDATVTLSGVTRNSDKPNYYRAETNSEGQYAFEEIGTDDVYRLMVESKRWVGLNDWQKAPRLQLSSTSAVVHDLTLQRACMMLLNVVDSRGDPVASAQVDTRLLGGDRFTQLRTVLTNQQGLAEIGGLKPSTAEYLFGVSRRGYGFGMVRRLLVEPGQIVAANLTLEEGADVQGVAICSDGLPASGWRLYARPDWWDFNSYPGGVAIGEEGEFTLKNITPGKYDLIVMVPMGGGSSRSINVRSGVSLPPPEGSLRVTIDSPSPQGLRKITGRLVYEGESPDQGIWIQASSEGGSFHHGSAHVNAGEAEFEIAALPQGTYTIRISSAGIEEVTLKNITAPSDGLEVPIKVVEKPRLVGRVVDSDGNAVESFRLRVVKERTLRGSNYSQNTAWIGANDPHGAFSVGVVGPGVYRVTAAADGFAPATSESLNTDELPTEPVTLRLSSGVTLRGTVVDEQGQLIDGATVAARSASPQVMMHLSKRFVGEERAVKTVNGKFELADLPPGEEMLRVTHPDFLFATSEEILLEEADVELPPIALKRGGVVIGTAYDNQGQPRPGVAVLFSERHGYSGGRDQETGLFAKAITNELGRYMAQNLPEELCYVHLADEWDHDGVVRTAIRPSNGELRMLDLGGPGGLAGRLLIDGERATGVRVQLGGSNQHFGVFKAFTRTDSEGRFAFARPQPGRRVLWFQDGGQRGQWLRVAEVEFPASAKPGETIELGDLQYGGSVLEITVKGLTPKEFGATRVMLQRHDPSGTPVGSTIGRPITIGSPESPAVFRGVPPGKVEARLFGQTGVSLTEIIDIPEEATSHEATIEWPAETGSLEVTIAEDGQEKSGRSAALLRSSDGRVSAALRAESKDGALRIERLPAGDYYITDQFARDARRLIELKIEAGRTTPLAITKEILTPKSRQSGIVQIRWFSPNGIPLPGVEGKLRDANGEEVQRVTVQDAEWTCYGAPGEYFVTGVYPGYTELEAAVTISPLQPGDRIDGVTTVDLVLDEIE